MKDWQPKITKIDGVNYSRRTMPGIDNNDHQIEGMTVRALRQALANCDPDDVVVYMAEQLPETRDADLIFGCIGGLASDCPHGLIMLVGPEAVRGMKAAGKI